MAQFGMSMYLLPVAQSDGCGRVCCICIDLFLLECCFFHAVCWWYLYIAAFCKATCWWLIPLTNWLVVWLPCFMFPYIGNNHPNWLSYFSEGWPNHQPAKYIGYIPDDKWVPGESGCQSTSNCFDNLRRRRFDNWNRFLAIRPYSTGVRLGTR